MGSVCLTDLLRSTMFINITGKYVLFDLQSMAAGSSEKSVLCSVASSAFASVKCLTWM